MARVDRGFQWISCPPDAPRAGDNRRRGSPDAHRSDRRARTGRALRRAARPPSSARSAARAPRAGAPGRAGTSATTRKSRASGGLVAVCSSEMGRPPTACTSSARWMRCASLGWMRAAAAGSTAARRACSAGQPVRAASRIEFARGSPRSPAGSSAMPPISARRYSMVPPTSSGTRPRASMSSMALRGVAHELPRRIARARLDQVDQVMRHRARELRAIGLAVPMSSPRYTCAESTLTISTGNSRARRSAKSALARARGAGEHRDRPRLCLSGRAGTCDRARAGSPASRSAGRDCTGRRAASVPSAAAARSSPAA